MSTTATYQNLSEKAIIFMDHVEIGKSAVLYRLLVHAEPFSDNLLELSPNQPPPPHLPLPTEEQTNQGQ